jgi:hypothetical protein
MSPEDDLIRPELSCRDACSTGDLQHLECVLDRDFVAILSTRVPAERLLTMSRMRWLNAVRSGRIPLFQLEDLVVRLYRRNTMAIVTMTAVEKKRVETSALDGIPILVTDIWSRTDRWTLCERNSQVVNERVAEGRGFARVAPTGVIASAGAEQRTTVRKRRRTATDKRLESNPNWNAKRKTQNAKRTT